MFIHIEIEPTSIGALIGLIAALRGFSAIRARRKAHKAIAIKQKVKAASPVETTHVQPIRGAVHSEQLVQLDLSASSGSSDPRPPLEAPTAAVGQEASPAHVHKS